MSWAWRLGERYRRAIVVVIHIVLPIVSSYLAIWLRFDGDIPQVNWQPWVAMLPWLVVLRAVAFVPFRLYQGIWRYTSLWDLRNILLAVSVSSIAFYILVHVVLGLTTYPRAVFITDTVLLVCFLAGIRLIRRIYREWLLPHAGRKRVLIYGAGDGGELLVRDIKQNPSYGVEPIGFVDDDPSKVGQRIHGVPVLGTRAHLPTIMADRLPAEVLIAIPSATPTALRGIVKALEPFRIRITTLPRFQDLLSSAHITSQVRQLRVEDLLARVPVGLDTDQVKQLIGGARVLVTGAGGSIGSELCRQILDLNPARLVMLDRYENGLHAIHTELCDQRPSSDAVKAVLADVTDQVRLDAVFAAEQPQIVFHAAAHKHVPLLESNPCEAVKNNVRGSRLVAEASVRNGAQRFIMVSTDKAVNPTSVMGATKRVAELVTTAMAEHGRTTFSIVRFGNVLASNGSVVPRFMDQIRRGGPVTVTHPEVQRFFMLIPEAVQLVLHAAALGGQATIYVLEMGDQIKLVELAKDLIRLSGFVPEVEIGIRFVGLRPGEKLFEELVATGEVAEPSTIPGIRRVTPVAARGPQAAAVAKLEAAAFAGDTDRVIAALQELSPGFRAQPQLTT